MPETLRRTDAPHAGSSGKCPAYHARDFQAGQDLEPVAGAPPGTWKAVGNDPQFLLPYSLPAGWVRIRLRMTGTVRGRVEFFADTGRGFNLAERLERADIDPRGAVIRDFFVHCPRPVRGLRFDPLEQPGQFHLAELCVEAVSGLRVLGHAVRAKFRQLGNLGRLRRGLGRALSLLVRGRLKEIRRIVLSALAPPTLGAVEEYDPEAAYQAWRRNRTLTAADRDRLAREAAALAHPPRLSLLLPVSGEVGDLLGRTLESVRRQVYPHWELCLVANPTAPKHVLLEELARREPRLRLQWDEGKREGSRPWNLALALATGSHVGLLEPGDELAEHALLRAAQALAGDEAPDLLYSDEDVREPDGRHHSPFFKPDWSPEYLLAFPYTGRLALYRTERVRQLGGFRTELGPAAEYDLALRLTAGPARVGHLADVLYHRGAPPTGSAATEERRALKDYLAITGREGTVEPGPAPGYHRVRFAVRGSPKVSILIPSACRLVTVRGAATYFVRQCVESIRNRSTYEDYEILLVNDRELPGDLAGDLAWLKVRTVRRPGPFNWSASMNHAAGAARGDHLLFLNDDTEVLTPDWLEALLEFSQQPEVGAVGAKLLFPDGRLQHAGVVLYDGTPRHPFQCYPADHAGYHGSTAVPRNVSAVTGACLMTRADIFRALEGFDETFPLNFNDIDYCLRVLRSGRRVVCTPYARLVHHESATKSGVFAAEREAFRKRWGGTRDPFYNPNLSPLTDDYRIDVRPTEDGGWQPC